MINALFAVDYYGGMSLNGSEPWPQDLTTQQNFDRMTRDHVVVMCRQTWQQPSMPRPLLGRMVYVISDSPVLGAGTIGNNIVAEVLQLEKLNPGRTIWVIGGSDVIDTCSSILDAVWLTHKRGSYRTDSRLDLKKFLTGFSPVRAQVSPDFDSTLIKYTPIFKRQTTL